MALITFDLDGVLQRNPFNTGVFPHISKALASAYSLQFPDTSADQVAKNVVNLVRAEFRRRQEAGDWVGTYDWDGICNRVARDLAYTGEPIDVAPLVRHYCTPDHIYAYAGAHECLAALQAAGHTLKALTNGFAAYQDPVLEALGLRQFFVDVLTPDRCGTAKPFADFFAWAGSLPALHVGDTLAHDLLGARRAGFVGVWLPPKLPEELATLSPRERTHHARLQAYIDERLRYEQTWYHPLPAPDECQPHYVVRDLSEVPGVVADWVARGCRTDG